jgi:hypothetical protein
MLRLVKPPFIPVFTTIGPDVPAPIPGLVHSFKQTVNSFGFRSGWIISNHGQAAWGTFAQLAKTPVRPTRGGILAVFGER